MNSRFTASKPEPTNQRMVHLTVQDGKIVKAALEERFQGPFSVSFNGTPLGMVEHYSINQPVELPKQ